MFLLLVHRLPIPETYDAILAESPSFDFSFGDSETATKCQKRKSWKTKPEPNDVVNTSTIIGSTSKYVIRRLSFGDFDVDKDNSLAAQILQNGTPQTCCSVEMNDLRYFIFIISK